MVPRAPLLDRVSELWDDPRRVREVVGWRGACGWGVSGRGRPVAATRLLRMGFGAGPGGGPLRVQGASMLSSVCVCVCECALLSTTAVAYRRGRRTPRQCWKGRRFQYNPKKSGRPLYLVPRPPAVAARRQVTPPPPAAAPSLSPPRRSYPRRRPATASPPPRRPTRGRGSPHDRTAYGRRRTGTPRRLAVGVQTLAPRARRAGRAWRRRGGHAAAGGGGGGGRPRAGKARPAAGGGATRAGGVHAPAVGSVGAGRTGRAHRPRQPAAGWTTAPNAAYQTYRWTARRPRASAHPDGRGRRDAPPTTSRAATP